MRWWLVAPKIGALIAPPLFLALGVTVGGGLIGALGNWLAGHAASADASQIAFKIRIWAVAIAIGGTISALEHIEQSLTRRAMADLVKGSLTIFAAYAGAELGFWLIRWWMIS
ncbi:MAG: sporulation protein [Firmicutes bacterium]|jgi:hypothetical protein|nr:sporulation protein [Bacillota bacterium]